MGWGGVGWKGGVSRDGVREEVTYLPIPMGAHLELQSVPVSRGGTQPSAEVIQLCPPLVQLCL